MLKKENSDAIYDEQTRTLVLFNNNAIKEEERKIQGNVYINHDTHEIRLYNFNSGELTNKEKVEILYSILEESVLFPHLIKSKEVENIGEYVLLVNGYLLDGTFKEPKHSYNSIITELIDNTTHYDGEPECIEKLRTRVKYYYELYKDSIGVKEIIIPVTNSNLIEGYKEVVNMAIILRSYLRDKGHRVHIVEKRNIFSKYKQINVCPTYF